jgi:hypothetical protein
MRTTTLLLAVASLTLFACGGGDGYTTPDAPAADALCTVPEDTSATVKESGGYSVSQLEWDAELLTIPKRARTRYENDKGKEDISDRVLLNKALFAEAETRGLLDDPQVRMSARLAAEKAYVQALMSSVEDNAASDEAVQAYYDDNKDKYSRPMARVRHILVKEESLAKDLHQQITGGADLGELAKEHSTDRGSKGRGGELPWATKERWVPEFAAAAFSLEPDEVTDPIKSKFGYHIIQLIEKRDMQPLDEVRPGIERVLTRNAVRDFRDGIKDGLGLDSRRGPRGGADKIIKPADGSDKKDPKKDPKKDEGGE